MIAFVCDLDFVILMALATLLHVTFAQIDQFHLEDRRANVEKQSLAVAEVPCFLDFDDKFAAVEPDDDDCGDCDGALDGKLELAFPDENELPIVGKCRAVAA